VGDVAAISSRPVICGISAGAVLEIRLVAGLYHVEFNDVDLRDKVRHVVLLADRK
jgi:hypothetical protein